MFSLICRIYSLKMNGRNAKQVLSGVGAMGDGRVKGEGEGWWCECG
jgi:hypothetical protein